MHESGPVVRKDLKLRPVNNVARDGQQTGVLTKWLSRTTPRDSNVFQIREIGLRPPSVTSWSSVSTSTTLCAKQQQELKQQNHKRKIFVVTTSMLSLVLLASSVSAMKVLVTGAGGRLGKLVFEELKSDESFEPIGLARSAKAVKTLKKSGADESQIVSVDITEGGLVDAMRGCDAVVLCTSAVPKIKPWSIVKVLWKKTILRREDPGRPEFTFPDKGTPEEVDWLGAKATIDAAVEAGVGKFVFVSSMGGTQPDNFLNTIGKLEDGSGGDILLWKRKAERYLTDQKIQWTIIHPGGLIDEPKGERELLVDVDDKLLELKTRSVPRADVARVCKAALNTDGNISFDLASKPKGDGTPTADASVVFEALSGKTCDYSTVLPDPPSIF